MHKTFMIAVSTIAALVGSPVAAADNSILTNLDAVEWHSAGDGSPLEVAMLREAPDGSHAALVRMPAGFKSEVHAYKHAYQGITISGTWQHFIEGGETEDLGPGGYVYQKAAELHGDACVSTEPCIIYYSMYGPFEYIPK